MRGLEAPVGALGRPLSSPRSDGDFVLDGAVAAPENRAATGESAVKA